ncbi:MAG: hypothetical protein HJJLKODD_01588 [Phycisphaerae bacterium]|nr:hypothetical protein [Phycisphaerae bacterium]
MNTWRRTGLIALMGVLGGMAWASDPQATPGPTPDEAVQRLREGNMRFVEGKVDSQHEDAARRQETAQPGQKPFVTILSCADSRVPVELLFDQGIGDLFVIRVAGNVAANDEIGTIEYGAGHLHTPLLVVMGHTKCGAVTAVTQGAEVHGHLAELVSPIKPAVDQVKQDHPELRDAELVAAAIKANIWQAIADTLQGSAELRELVRENKLRVIGALYDLESGRVEFLGRHPDELQLLTKEAAAGTDREPKKSAQPATSNQEHGTGKD